MRGDISEFEGSIRASHSSVHQEVRNEIPLRSSREFGLRVRRIGKVGLV